ncbi:MAG: DUF4394 domain-containing protein [Saprospiraceae bacterium]|nr:DUF4394 domain-containing protein [Saprospiraceae bacterium]
MMNFKSIQFKQLCLFLISTVLLSTISCRKQEDKTNYDLVFVALSDDNNLLTINANNSAMPLKQVGLRGLAANEKMVAIDYRPATGQLYGVSNASRLYVINSDSGTVRAIGANPFTPAINGSVVGLDFNPTVDRIRLVTNTGQNLRLNPETGAVAATDGNLNPSTPSVSEVAYTNNKSGATTTTLYDIDVTTDKLYIQNPPNNGTLVEVGSLGVDAESAAGFDITDNDLGMAALTVGGKSELYVVNLTTGSVLKLGNFPFSSRIIGLAISTQAVAYAVDGSNNLQIFNPYDPQPVSKAITGLQMGENILGIDMRPANGQLYALGSTNRLYTLNMSSGAATQIGSPFATSLDGTDFGFDFNPTVDRIRIVSNKGQNLRVHPETAAIAAVDGALNPGTPSVSAAAYTNNFAGAATTVLYVVDAQNQKIYIQNPPNNGTLQYVADLSSPFFSLNGFDIGGTSGKGFLLLSTDGVPSIYQINLQTGVLTKGKSLNFSIVRGLAIGLGF